MNYNRMTQSVTSSTPLALSSALSPSRYLPPSNHSPSQVRSLPVGISLLHNTSTLKCALSQSVSPSPTPFPSTLKCALSQSVSPSSTHSIPLSSAPSPSR